MANKLTQEEISLRIGEAILEAKNFEFDDLIEHLFEQEASSVSSVLKTYVRNEWVRQIKNLCRITAKNKMASKLEMGSSDFIQKFMNVKTEDDLLKVFPEFEALLKTLKENNSLGSLLAELTRVFNKLRDKFVPSKSEDELRRFLIEWFQSGAMPLSIWKLFNKWKSNGPTLDNLRMLESHVNDSNWQKFTRILKDVKTDKFVEAQKWNSILEIYFSEPKLTVNGSTVKLISRIVYISEWLNPLEKLIESNAITEVAIYAEDNIILDGNLANDVWRGKNLIMASQTVNVWQEVKICLSGKSHSQSNRKAASAKSTRQRGEDGRDGRAGESSGNLVILATKMMNSTKLTVELNGGRGEDGEDGGDGCDGKNGLGVTQSDVDRLVVSYYSLYRDSWDKFEKYSPPNNWSLVKNHHTTGDYIYRTYNDELGRTITYSFAGDKGYFYTTYDLYFLMRGSDGTSGTSGGRNGVGGQGGYNGTSVVKNPETNDEYQIKFISQGKSGPDGMNGKVGTSGKFGINGNDMVLIDRSAKEASKHYEGSSDKKLDWNYVYKAEYKSRLDGYRRYHEKETACFIKFSYGQKIDTLEKRATQTETRTVRKTSCEAVAKQSISIGKILAEAECLFGRQNAFLAEACKATSSNVSLGEQVDEEEEVDENVSEEVVILRQKDDNIKLSRYTLEGDKKVHEIRTPEIFVTSLKQTGPQITLNKLSQFLFDLFQIEFHPVLLESIVLNVILYQSKYRSQMQSSLSLVLLSVLQSKILNGKTFDEIKQFNSSLPIRRTFKFSLSRLRLKFHNITEETRDVQVMPSLVINPGNEEYFGVKEGLLSEKLDPYTQTTNVKRIVQNFFSEYPIKEVSLELLKAFNIYLNTIQPQFHEQLNKFSRDHMDWHDKDKVQIYLDSLSGFLTEDSSDEKIDGPLKQPKTDVEHAFSSFLNAYVADKKIWNNLIKPINKIISESKEYTARFGKPPKFDSNKITSYVKSNQKEFIEQAKHLIKVYFVAKSVLKFNRCLYTLNALMKIEQATFSGGLEYTDKDDGYDAFINQYERTPLNCESDECEAHMIKNGLSCFTFRYYLSNYLDIKICTYQKVSFQTLKKVETVNPTATRCEIIWLKDDKSVVGIAPHEDIRVLDTAQRTILSRYEHDLADQMNSLIEIDFNRTHEMKLFASFFPSALQNTAIQWIETYMAATNDQSLIKLLYNRMWVDGCHLTLFEFQSILVMLISLKQVYHCSLDYLLILANSTEQVKLIDVLLYLKLEYHIEKRFDSKSKIFNAIQTIQDTRFKSLFAVKLRDYESPLEEEDIYKVCLMLQNASNGSEQLEKICFDEWISIARRQKWSEIGYLLQKYGSIGYYLGVLDNNGFKDEERKMRESFDEATLICEKMIALYTQWIITREIEANDDFFRNLKRIFKKINDYPGLVDKQTKHQLVTDEIEQSQLINWLRENGVYQLETNVKDRSVEDLTNKITGLHDSLEDVPKRRERVKQIAQLLEQNDGQKSKTIFWLNKFDDALLKLRNIRLRDTQKMAILCALESDGHVLEQVNTGEGKTFIIAAIAAIHVKSGKRYVDVITSSPVLAQRDSIEMKDVYEELGLTVSHNCSENFDERKQAYLANIVYGDIARFQRDYLLHSFYKRMIKGDRTQVVVIVDEVDNMLLDNGNNMLYLSHLVPGMDLLDSLLIYVQQMVNKPIYSGDKNDFEEMQRQFDNKTIKMKILDDLFGQFSIEDLNSILKSKMSSTEIESIYELLIKANIIDSDGYLKIFSKNELNTIDTALGKLNKGYIKLIRTCFSVILERDRSIELPVNLRNFARLHLDELIENSKHSLFLEPNTGYVVDLDRTGKLTNALEPLITIIDPNTGADLATSQWSGGLHQFLQLKHGCRLSPISLKAVFVSNVAYLNRYERINGLSGTLGSTEESKTLIQLYKADLIKIPTNRPKTFYEHVPVISTVKDEWILNIYSEICDQVSVCRSVLLICEDIKQLEDVQSGLLRLFAADKHASYEIKECFNNVTIYKREHDEFNFEGSSKFQPKRLIIATNLAGRGTDIKLSDGLIKAGGLHVITCFMPKNCRIEEQAFGRAARSGQPGSGQIISYTEPLNEVVKPSVFQLKIFRDNAEVHRLQSLKKFYDFHTEIEERCLHKFHSYCEKALSAIYSNNTNDIGTTSDSLPTPSQVVYFALLDEWSLWLDSKTPLINQCSLEYDTRLKETIIESVDEFLVSHSFGKNKSNCFEEAKSWLTSPQSLLTIGIIQMFHNNGFKDADDTFDSILENGHEFAAEAFYYKACMRMKNLESMRNPKNTLKLTKQEAFVSDIDKAFEYFYKSRTAFLHRLLRKNNEASIVAQMIEKLPENNPKTSGYASQVKSIVANIQLALNNIDCLIGSPCDPNMFTGDEITEEYSTKIFDSLLHQGIIHPTLLTSHRAEDWQLRPFRQKYKLHRNQIETMLTCIYQDQASLVHQNRFVLDQAQIVEYCPLSTKSEFWTELESQHVIYDPIICVAVHDWSKLSNQLVETFNNLKEYSIANENCRTLLRYSSQNDLGKMYKLEDVQESINGRPHLVSELNRLVDNETLKLDKFANIVIVPEEMSYFSNFDGVTLKDLKDFFNLDDDGAAWILNNLEEDGVLKLQSVRMKRFTSDTLKWSKLVRCHLEANAKRPEGSIELIMMYENAGILQQIKDSHKILNINKQVLGAFCRVPDGLDRDKCLNKFYDYLKKEELLEYYLYNVWRMNSKLDCSSLPPCIANRLDEFLSDRLAYTFSLEHVCMSLEKANKNPYPTPSQIFLPENPFREVYKDFINCGLAIPSRLSKNLDEIDFDDFKHSERIKSILVSSRFRLNDQTGYHMSLIPFSKYAQDNGLAVDSDFKNMINNGFKFVVAESESNGSWYMNKVIGFVASVWNSIKSIASSIGSFCCSVIEFVNILPIKIFKTASEFVSPFVKQAGQMIMRIAQPLLNTRFGKAAVSGLQYVGDLVVEGAYKTVDGIEWIFDRAKDGINYISHKATDLVNWIGDTRIVKGAIKGVKSFGSWIASTDIFKAAVNMATYVYTKMSNFCTAIVESYEYYNQCRTMARRITLEKSYFIDEHTILKTFNGVTQFEMKKFKKGMDDVEVIENSINKSLGTIMESLLQTFDRTFDRLLDTKYSFDLLHSYLKTKNASNSLNMLQSEIKILLNLLAWKVQVEYFQKLKDAFENKKSLKESLDDIKTNNIDFEIQYFIKYALEKILDDLHDTSKDEGYESESNQDLQYINMIETSKNWKEALKEIYSKLARQEIEKISIGKTKSIILAYVASLSDSNTPPSELQANFLHEDKCLKQALLEYSTSNQSKKKTQFLISELDFLNRKLIDSSGFGENKNLIKNTIKYGYPLPLSCAQLIVTLFDEYLKRSNIYKSGIELEIIDERKHLVSKHRAHNAGARFQIQAYNGAFYICQSDYRASIGMSNKLDGETNGLFLYEVFVSKMKYLEKHFPKKAETLRKGLLNEF